MKVTQAVDALATKTVESITASFESTCAVASGQLYCWGRNASGELGNGTLVQSASPVYATQSFPIDFNLIIGGVSVPAVSQTQASLVFVTPPATAPGLVDIQLTADNIGSTTLTEAYEYVAAPTITNVSPGSSLKTGGDTIVISGTGFSSDVVVRVGGQPATGVTRISSRTLTAIVPPAAVAGVVDISVQNNDGQTATLTNSFTYHNLAPTIVSIAPSEGPTAGGNTVTITGANFADKNSTSNTWSNTNKTITGGTYGSQLAVVGDTVYLYGGYNTNTILSASVNDPTAWKIGRASCRERVF